jgi:6-pyruvoyl-tetrahydropterin synthase
MEHFNPFIGFKNKVCTNLCVLSDGLLSDVKVHNLSTLKIAIRDLLEPYSHGYHLHQLEALTNYSITEQQFAHLIGKCWI